MITTRFGSSVTLIAPVDWNHGWVQAVIKREDGDAQQLVYLCDLKADGGLNEIAAASKALEEHLCRDCGQPMDTHFQEQRAGLSPLAIVTCFNRACALWSVTLSTEQYALQTDAQWQDYREIVAGLKARLGESK